MIIKPEIEGAEALMFAIAPDPGEHVYLDVFSVEDSNTKVEDVIRDFYTRQNDLEPHVCQMFLKSPFHVSWHTDSEGSEYRLLVVDNRNIASVYKSLSRFNSDPA